MNQPKVSIGMPVFNGGPYLEAAIKSLLMQEYQDFELIIGDNCSQDYTERLVLKYMEIDPRIKYYRHSKNMGGLYNFEFVKNKAKGEYFMWAAHDDYWCSNHIKNAVKVLDDNGDIGFVFPTFRLRSAHLKFYKEITWKIFKFIESDNRKNRILGYVNLHHSSHKCNLVYSLFRLSLLNEVYEYQNVENDGLLSTLLVAKARGHVPRRYTFEKRYKFYWPGFLMKQIYLFKKLCHIKDNQEEFKKTLKSGTQKLSEIFPEYGEIFQLIRQNYSLTRCNRDYTIVEKLEDKYEH